jgi:hypothetical protein
LDQPSKFPLKGFSIAEFIILSVHLVWFAGVLYSEGKVVASTNQIDTQESLCFRERILGAVTLKPPEGQFHLWVELNVN